MKRHAKPVAIHGLKQRPKTEHHYVTTTQKVDTCEEKSEYTVEKCSECGDVKSTSKKLYYSAHDFQFTSHKKEPTCTEKGEDLYTCTICNETETREVAATGHDTELVNVKEPTCTDFGYSGDEVCKKCNQVVKSGKKIEPNGHKYLATMFTKYEIQESMGLKYKYSYEAEHWICKNCDYERIDTDYTTWKLVGWILADGTEVVANRHGIDAGVEPGQKVTCSFAAENAVLVDLPDEAERGAEV